MRAVVLFPGQGAQYVGMGREYVNRYGFAKSLYAEASDAAGFDVLRLSEQGPEELLTSTAYAQPAILTAGYTAYRALLEETGLEPEVMAGHSLGEITALTCAGAIPFHDAVRLVHRRGQLMQEAAAAGIGAMVSVMGMDARLVEEACREHSGPGRSVVVSGYNSEQQTVISGHREAVAACADGLRSQGAGIVELKVSAPFHSPLMQAAAAAFQAELERLVLRPLTCTVVSTVTALPYEDEASLIPLLTGQLTAPVKWLQAMQYIAAGGKSLCIDMGPSSVVLNLMKKTAPGMQLFAYDQEQDRRRLHQLMRHARPKRPFADSFVARCLAIAVCTPNANWNSDEYEEGVSRPYKEIHQLQLQLDEQSRPPTEEEMLQALRMLQSVFRTKGTGQQERRMRFEQLMNETGTQPLFEKLGGLDYAAGEEQYSISR